MRNVEKNPPESWPPVHAVLDAGGESGAGLSNAIYGSIEPMLSGQVLHVISRDLGSLVTVPDWCFVNGHALLHTHIQGDDTLFWIMKQ